MAARQIEQSAAAYQPFRALAATSGCEMALERSSRRWGSGTLSLITSYQCRERFEALLHAAHVRGRAVVIVVGGDADLQAFHPAGQLFLVVRHALAAGARVIAGLHLRSP